jgi:NADPH:quinone reductase-like Zn-dependent oxidoreductase
MFRSGQYVDQPVFPSKIGYEASGEVESLGSGVDGLKIGDAVSVVPAFAMADYGVHGELVIAPATAVVKHPPSLSWEAAAAVWMAFIAAYGGLIDLAKLQAGDTILIPAASSSVGLAAIQIARMVGAHPVALTRTSAKRAQLLEAGAETVIATAEEDVAARVRELTGGAGARVIFDPVGGPGFAALVAAAARHAMIIIYGALSPGSTPVSWLDMFGKRLTLRGYELFEVTTDDARRQAAIDFILDGLARNLLKPVIAKTFVFDDFVDAHRYIEAGSQVGKVVVTVPR